MRPPARPRGTGAREVAAQRYPNPLARALMIFGPGVVSGASDDDPAGIGTYAVAGASLGFSILWTMLITLPMMAVAQYIAARIGIVTGTGLAAVLRRRYPRVVGYATVAVLAAANTVNAGADIGAIAASLNLLVPVPAVATVIPIAVALLSFEIWGSYRLISDTFRWLALVLVAYIGAAFLARPHWADVLRGTFVPTIAFTPRVLSVIVALLGTSLSPYVWFWQASQEEEEKIAIGQRRLRQRQGTSATELRYAAWDVGVGMLFAQVVAYFVILATAATLFTAGKTEVVSATQAASALRPLAGNAARLLFALGLIGSGALAVPVLTGTAAYAVSEALGWRHGFSERPGRAPGFYAIIACSTLLGMAMNFVGINPITALFWTSLMFGFMTPPLLALLLLISNDRAIMGERVNGLGLNVVGWATVVVMTGAAVGLVLVAGK